MEKKANKLVKGDLVVGFGEVQLVQRDGSNVIVTYKDGAKQHNNEETVKLYKKKNVNLNSVL